MDDDALRRLAIAEIIYKINQNKRNENPTSQPAINPLYRANKTFLRRTINSALQHNRRQHMREKENSSKKLYELERHSKRTTHDSQSKAKSHNSSTVHGGKSRKRRKQKVKKSSSATNESSINHQQPKTFPYFVESLHEIESKLNHFHSEYFLHYDNPEVSSAYAQMYSYYAAMMNLSQYFNVCNASSQEPNLKSCEEPVVTIDLTKNEKISQSKEKCEEKRRKRSKSHISIDSSSENCNESMVISLVESSSESESI